MTPNQEPVERWQDQEVETIEDLKQWILMCLCIPEEARAFSDEEFAEAITKFISHQKALSRAEGIRSVVELVRKNDNKYHAGYYCIEEKILNNLSDTLAVVDELGGKK